MTKQQARAEAKARWRRYSPEALAALGHAMAAALFALPQWQRAATVFCFVPLPGEPDVTPVLRRALAEGKRLAVPRVLPGGGMEAVVIRELSALRPQAYGILEPVGGEVLPPQAMTGALALIPCLAADRRGVRLGRGGGYYDRFLAHYKGERLLLCPRALLFDTLPCEEWDAVFQPTEILTEKGIQL